MSFNPNFYKVVIHSIEHLLEEKEDVLKIVLFIYECGSFVRMISSSLTRS